MKQKHLVATSIASCWQKKLEQKNLKIIQLIKENDRIERNQFDIFLIWNVCFKNGSFNKEKCKKHGFYSWKKKNSVCLA